MGSMMGVFWEAGTAYPSQGVLCFVLFVCVLCLVYLMLPASLDCPFLIDPLVFSNVYLSCVLYAMLPLSLDCPFLIAPSVFSNVYLSCVLCLMLSVSLDCTFLIVPSVFSNVNVLYILLWIGQPIFWKLCTLSKLLPIFLRDRQPWLI